MALQITLFPNQGVCIGVASHHAICDGSAIVCFLHTWASINKFKDEKHLLALGWKVLPVFDRTAVEDSGEQTPIFWEMMKNSTPTVSSAISFPTHKLCGTFIPTDEEVLKLKNFLLCKKPGVTHVSSFAAVCARVWSYLAGAAAASGEKVSNDERDYLSMPADCRGRLNPPLPSTYFGNCLVPVLAESAHDALKGNSGFVTAAEAIEEAINNALGNEKRVLDGCVEGHKRFMKLKGKRMVGVTGSPRLDLSGIDYGWGGMKKLEALHIDVSGSFSLCKTRDGVEVGMSMPKVKMDAFVSLFNRNVYDHMGSKL